MPDSVARVVQRAIRGAAAVWLVEIDPGTPATPAEAVELAAVLTHSHDDRLPPVRPTW